MAATPIESQEDAHPDQGVDRESQTRQCLSVIHRGEGEEGDGQEQPDPVDAGGVLSGGENELGHR